MPISTSNFSLKYSTIFLTLKCGPIKFILSKIVYSFGITFISFDYSVFGISFINLFSSGIVKLNILEAKLKVQFLNCFKLYACNKVKICNQLNPVIAAVVEAIAGIILPAISFTFKKFVVSIL